MMVVNLFIQDVTNGKLFYNNQSIYWNMEDPGYKADVDKECDLIRKLISATVQAEEGETQYDLSFSWDGEGSVKGRAVAHKINWKTRNLLQVECVHAMERLLMLSNAEPPKTPEAP